jgi:hypothetical protein
MLQMLICINSKVKIYKKKMKKNYKELLKLFTIVSIIIIIFILIVIPSQISFGFSFVAGMWGYLFFDYLIYKIINR